MILRTPITPVVTVTIRHNIPAQAVPLERYCALMPTSEMLLSKIASTHPHKAAIEARFRRLLTALGDAWYVSVLIEERGQRGVCLGRKEGGKVTRIWSTTLEPEEK